ncbi:MAG: DUF928 domain-containing protein [Candidatus Competibacter sp.]|nr:DUF928 domain-containing protein [Candidatus Competibacter sp.]MDG4584157.1 DUF928 domain-containing protein [Candidatus Competibacter sp.]
MNKLHISLPVGLALAFSILATPSRAQTQPPVDNARPKPAAQTAQTPPIASQTTPVYRPPLRGAPATRVGGANRGGSDGVLILGVLAPESTGLTSRARPTLYWYSSIGLAAPLEFTLNDDHSIKPLVELKIPASQPGIHALPLDYTLQPEVEYRWAIAAVIDPEQRARDVIASGTIKQVRPSPTLAAQLSRASQREWPFLYAREGFWYDAIAILSEQIDATPANRHLWEQRAALLEQVGLKIAATYDQGANP